ncbi:MAG: hypothetical protein ACRYGG_01035 [Janthinobacterium lividum]
MPTPLTKRQTALARHALGLPNERRHAFRNWFVAGPGHADYDDWMAMTGLGYAVRRDGRQQPFGGSHLFRLTRAGAGAALLARESYDPLNFPVDIGETALGRDVNN